MRTQSKLVEVRRRPRRAAAEATSLDDLESLAVRFHAPYRREVRRLVRASERMADLARVFPGAIHVIAGKQGPAAARLQAVSLVEQGAPLKIVARTLRLPLWLRRLPPEAFRGEVGELPGSEIFSRRIANRLPVRISDAANWLAAVSFAARACHEDFAVWIAEQPVTPDEGEAQRLLAVLAGYAWHSTAPATAASALIVVPWRSEIGFDTALCAAKSWLNRMRLLMQIRDGAIADSWLTAGEINGYTFQPLTDARDILDEAHAMQNCADQYAERLARDKCRLFSVRRNGLRAATLEVGPHQRETGVLTIVQLKARHNMPAPLEVWQAAYAWMASQTGLKRMPPIMSLDRPFNEAEWSALMAPYRAASGGAPWLPAQATPITFASLDLDMINLARRSGVTSWLFT